MSLISVSGLTFAYDTSIDCVFENAFFSIDTDWKLGFIGRNGKGKTTFLKLLMGKYEYKGNISASVSFDYFPFIVKNLELNAYSIANEIDHDIAQWMIDREVSLLNMDPLILLQPFKTLSKGEQTKVLLAILFSRENNFLLIDEPTNHLDLESRHAVARYLNRKKGFILVSHDRIFLDACIDHVLSINRSNIEIQKGNFSSWLDNRQRQDNFELAESKKLANEINQLKESAKRTTGWASKGSNNARRDGSSDSRTIGFKAGHQKGAAKLDKAAKRLVDEKEKAISQKSMLLKNIETAESLQLNYSESHRSIIIDITDLSVNYNNKEIFNPVSFSVKTGSRIQLKGINGCGKSSIMKLLMGEKISYSGNISIVQDLKISYVSQDTSFLRGSLVDFTENSNINPTLFRTLLAKMDFSASLFDNEIENYSEGQKKKLLIARSLCEEAELYIWDEPLNHIDILTRIQIEELILTYKPTMIFVEHDEMFSEKIATEVISIIHMDK